MEQISLLSTKDTPSRKKGKQITIISTSSAQEIKQYAIAMAQHADSNIRVRTDGAIIVIPPDPYELPDEIMAHIFSLIKSSPSTLYACTLANKRCYELANPMLWKTPAFLSWSMTCRFLDCMVAMTDQRRNTLGRLIHDIRLTSLYCTDKTPSRLLLHMPNLQHLTLVYCENDKIIHQLPKLTSLKLHRSFVTETGFDAIAQCPLETFDWTLSSVQSPEWLTHLAGCPLRRLSIDCTAVRPHINPLSFDRILQQATAAEIARLLMTPFTSFLCNPSTFPQLTYLSVCQCSDIHDATLVAFFNNHPHLEEVHLSMQFTITDATLDAMHLPRLKRASLTYMERITSPAVRRLIKACPLNYLDISDCEQVVPSDFPELSVTEWGITEWGALNSPELDKIRASV